MPTPTGARASCLGAAKRSRGAQGFTQGTDKLVDPRASLCIRGYRAHSATAVALRGAAAQAIALTRAPLSCRWVRGHNMRLRGWAWPKESALAHVGSLLSMPRGEHSRCATLALTGLTRVRNWKPNAANLPTRQGARVPTDPPVKTTRSEPVKCATPTCTCVPYDAFELTVLDRA
jgi:hypothetical protein